MDRFPAGIILLILLSLLVYLGLAHRVLDRMRLSDRAALAVIAAMLLGSFVDIPLSHRMITVSVNVGGALVPVGLAVYLLSGAGTPAERTRALWGALITGVTVYLLGTYVMRGIQEPAGRYAYTDPLYLYPLVAGLVGYLAGRSRRGAFVASTLGVVLGDIFQYIKIAVARVPAKVDIGGGGIFDVVVFSGTFAVLLAEVIGEIRERAQGGPDRDDRPENLLVNLRLPGGPRAKGDGESEADR